MATIFGGGTANGARSTRGRSQSLEEPTNGLKDGKLKRADSEGSSGSNSKEGTPLAESAKKKEEVSQWEALINLNLNKFY